MSGSRAYLIDASIYIFRAWFSLPDQWHTSEGMPLNAVYGYTRFLLEFLRQQQPSHVAATFDESLGSCFRNELYPAYKASRDLPDEALGFQLNTCRAITERLDIPSYGGADYEADDYLASLARLYRRRDIPVTVVTRDKDLGQIIVGPGDQWWDYAAGVCLDVDAFTARFNVRPDQFADYLALVGDPVDDVPGVPGIGAKTAATLLRVFGDLDRLAANLGQVGELSLRGAKRVQQRLEDHWPTVELARSLTTLEQRVPGLDRAPDFELRAARLHDLAHYLAELGLEGPLTRRCEALARELEV
jgi:5'-3' exonuclease